MSQLLGLEEVQQSLWLSRDEGADAGENASHTAEKRSSYICLFLSIMSLFPQVLQFHLCHILMFTEGMIALFKICQISRKKLNNSLKY